MNELSADEVLTLCTSNHSDLCRLREYIGAFPHHVDRVGKYVYGSSMFGNSREYTPFEMAVITQSQACVELLVDLGADVNLERDDDRWCRHELGPCPLLCAARSFLIEIIPCLVAHGATISRDSLICGFDEPHYQLRLLPALMADEHPSAYPPDWTYYCKCHNDPHERVFCHFASDCISPDYRAESIKYYMQLVECNKRDIKDIRMATLWRRGAEACFGLAALNLPAFVTLAIIEEMNYAILALPMHVKWYVICAIKHFHTVEQAEALAADPHPP